MVSQLRSKATQNILRTIDNTANQTPSAAIPALENFVLVADQSPETLGKDVDARAVLHEAKRQLEEARKRLKELNEGIIERQEYSSKLFGGAGGYGIPNEGFTGA